MYTLLKNRPFIYSANSRRGFPIYLPNIEDEFVWGRYFAFHPTKRPAPFTEPVFFVYTLLILETNHRLLWVSGQNPAGHYFLR